jgi:phosphate-selective porin OprO/OprP
VARAIGLGFAILALAGSATAGEDPAPAAETSGGSDEPAVRVEWQKGSTRLHAPGIHLELSNRLQVRWTGVWPGDSDGTSTGSFRVRRAKTKLSGWVYSERVGFGLQVNRANSVGVLEDAFLELDATGDGALLVKLGQYKLPFGRQLITSSGSLQFVDRSITTEQFTRTRDIGLMFHGDMAGGRLGYAAGVFNGSGPGATRNDDGRYQLDARVQMAPNGDPGYSEPDLASSERPLYAVAGQYERNDDGLGDDRLRLTTWGADAIFKYRGISALGEYFWARAEPAGELRIEREGYTLQAGYYLQRVRLERAGRLARWETGGADVQRETGAALSWYRDGHRFKVQADLRFLEGATDDTELRIQTQLVF